MEDAGFVFEREQRPHLQNRRDKELKFVHPQLEQIFSKAKLKNLAKKFYVKPLSDSENSEIGLTTGKTSPLFFVKDFPPPNSHDTFNHNTALNAWVNRPGDESLNSLLRAISNYLTPTLEVHEEEFRSKVSESLKQNAIQRRQRILVAPKKPRKIKVTTVAYERNPDVVAEVLIRANGKCEICDRVAPFIRKKDKTPYLEVHHKQQLSKGGDDTIQNAIALCPNCHREQHFG